MLVSFPSKRYVERWSRSPLGGALKDLFRSGIQKKILKIGISRHNRTSETYVPLDILNIYIFYLGSPGNDCMYVCKTPKQHEKLAGEGCFRSKKKHVLSTI